MPWKLIIEITDGPQRGEKFEFVQDSVLIGRSSRSDLVLRDSAVSAEHCRIHLEKDMVEIEDLGSKNGTFVNQLAVERSVLKSGDRIQLGRSELSIQLERLSSKEQADYILYPSVMIAGFNETDREILKREMSEGMVAKRCFGFSNGEELLIELLHWWERSQSPDLIILDLKMPIINGINTAISVRAYEKAYQKDSLIPLVFFFDPPDSSAFKKVLAFCSPALHFPRKADKMSFAQSAKMLVKNLRRAPLKAKSG